MTDAAKPSNRYDEMQGQIGAFVREHPSLIASVATIGLLVLRLMFVTRGNSVTAASLVSSAGPLAVGVAVLVTTLPVILTLTLAYGIVGFVDLVTRRSSLNWLHVLTIWLFLPAAIILSPLDWAAVFGLAAIWGFIGWLFSLRRKTREPLLPNLSLLVILAFFLLQPGDTMWIPAERIELRSGPPVVGYVVDLGEWATILREDDRLILRIRSDDIEARQACAVDNRQGREILAAWVNPGNSPDYPDCNVLVQEE